MSAAHDEATIDEALERTDAAFADINERLANGSRG
jgi:hypothetical protein